MTNNNITSLYTLIKQKSKEKGRKLKIICDWDECLQPWRPMMVYRIGKIDYPFKEFFENFWENVETEPGSATEDRKMTYMGENPKEREAIRKFNETKSKRRKGEVPTKIGTEGKDFYNSENKRDTLPFLSIAEELLLCLKEDLISKLVIISAHQKSKKYQPRKIKKFQKNFGKFPNTEINVFEIDRSSGQNIPHRWESIKEHYPDFDIFIDDNHNVIESMKKYHPSNKILVLPDYKYARKVQGSNIYHVKTTVSIFKLKMNINSGIHVPVMLKETLDYLNLKQEGIYIDCTFGKGGHSRLILEKLEKGKLIAFEWDEKSSQLAQTDNSFSSPQFYLINDNFANLEEHLKKMGIQEVDGFLFDLGLSSDQLAEEDRGFSYRSNSPLDMRISRENELKAEEIINHYPCEKLADIFYHYGEERKARVIARKICYWREKEKIVNSEQLVGIIASCFSRKGNKHPARKVFQALRIFINQELENLTKALEAAFKYLAKEGRIVVISYHSLEDRIVKQTFKKFAANHFQIITKKPLIPTQLEITKNHRARSAKMRVVERKV